MRSNKQTYEMEKYQSNLAQFALGLSRYQQIPARGLLGGHRHTSLHLSDELRHRSLPGFCLRKKYARGQGQHTGFLIPK